MEKGDVVYRVAVGGNSNNRFINASKVKIERIGRYLHPLSFHSLHKKT